MRTTPPSIDWGGGAAPIRAPKRSAESDLDFLDWIGSAHLAIAVLLLGSGYLPASNN
jgi:hypothetical protein